MHPYARFLIDFERRHLGLIHRNSLNNTRAAVIIETRPLFFLPKVVRNVMFFLGPQWNLHVFGSPESMRYLQDCLPGWDVWYAAVSPQYRLGIDAYNRILLSAGFWGALREEKILLFQPDSLLTGANIEEFAGYDYVGAPCRTFDEGYVANGGLSLRTREAMHDCVRRFDPEPGEAEDVFFSRAVRSAGAAMPDLRTAARFSVESIYAGHPVGVHGTDKFFHSVEVAERITRAVRD
jgi:hypothetical protein